MMAHKVSRPGRSPPGTTAWLGQTQKWDSPGRYSPSNSDCPHVSQVIKFTCLFCVFFGPKWPIVSCVSCKIVTVSVLWGRRQSSIQGVPNRSVRLQKQTSSSARPKQCYFQRSWLDYLSPPLRRKESSLSLPSPGWLAIQLLIWTGRLNLHLNKESVRIYT